MPDATPIFTKRDPATGAVLFDFTGHINAEGLDLSSGPVNAITDLQAITWRRDDNNALSGAVAAFDSAITNDRSIFVGTNRDGATDVGQTASYLSIGTGAALGQVSATATLRDGSSPRNAQIIDTAGKSSFPQLWPGATDTRVTMGNSTVIFTASNLSAVRTINHNMGRAPSWVFPGMRQNLSAFVVLAVTAVTATQISFQGYIASGAAVSLTQDFSWLAYG